jgi:ribosomal protein S18 acetylase RimI-like enzyme
MRVRQHPVRGGGITGVIRLARPDDQPAVEACIADAYEKFRPMINRTPGPMLDDYQAFIAEGHVDVYELPDAEGHPEIVGVMVAFGEPRDDPEHYEIETLAVLEKCQGEGIGKAFLALAEERIRARSIQWARLYTNEVMTENYAWYKRWGYVDYERRHDRGYNRIFFEKQIAPVAVRRVRPGEGPQLRDIRVRALTDTPEAFATRVADVVDQPSEYWEGQIAGADNESRRYVAIANGAWVGMVGTFRSAGGLELIAMWTDPSMRGRGAGQLLVESVLRHANQPVSLWVIRGNDSAQRLYQRCGFVTQGDYVASEDDPCRTEIRMIHR